jgi:hypothetical protein
MTPEERVSLSRAEDEPERKALEDIRTYGMHWLDVFDGEHADRGFCYSVGLWHTHNHPEVIIFGLKSELCGRVLNGINRDIREGGSFQAGLSSLDCLAGFRCYFEAFPKEQYRAHLGWHDGFIAEMIFRQCRCCGRQLRVFTRGIRRRVKSSRICSPSFQKFLQKFPEFAEKPYLRLG